MAMSIFAQKMIRESLSYQEVLNSAESHLWKNAIDDEVKLLEDNHKWDLVDISNNDNILHAKWVYKLKYVID